MDTAKTTTRAFRIEPRLKDMLCITADRDRRSIANMVEVMIGDYCGREGISIDEPGVLLVDVQKTTKNGKKK